MTTNEVIETLKEYSEYCSFKGTYPWNDRIELSMAMAIEALQERKTGKWNYYRCSECKCLCTYFLRGSYVIDIENRPNYCPYCGAKMEVDE